MSNVVCESIGFTLHSTMSPYLKKLYKAGMLDKDLKLTARGRQAVNAVSIEAFKAELEKKADAVIAEDVASEC